MLFLFLLLIVAGCKEQKSYPANSVPHNDISIESKMPLVKAFRNNIKPLEDPSFITVHGWIDDTSILYSRYDDNKTYIMSYNFINGQLQQLFESNYPITGVYPNSTRSYILIQASGNQNNSIITILDEKKNTVYKKVEELSQLEYRWSPFNEEEILISYYYDNQNTKVELLNIFHPPNKKTLDVQPYVKWLNPTSLIYFDWGSGQNVSANLYQFRIQDEKKSLIGENITDFETSKNAFMIVKTNSSDQVLSFQFNENDDDLAEIATFEIPLLESNSGYYWTPSYDWDDTNQRLITFTPKEAGNLLEYTQGYDIVTFDINNNNRTTLVKDVPHSSIKCSPSGRYCLYGYRLNKLIDTKTNEVVIIMETEEG